MTDEDSKPTTKKPRVTLSTKIINAVLVELLLLVIGIISVIVVPACFPIFESASSFSTSLVESPPEFDFLGLYIPSNPFDSLANNVVPAVVLFCILLGAALIGVEGKEGLLHNLDVVATALNNVNGMVIKLTPYGVFAIGAATAGTLAILMFVPFAAWYLGRVLSFGDWLVFLGSGTLSSFAVVIPKPDVTLGSSGSGAVNPQALSSSMPPRQV